MGSNERSAHIATDARLAAMIRHLDGVYSEAHAELAEKWEAYLLRKDKRLRKLWEAFRDAPNRAEKLKAKAAYERAFRNAVLRDERFRILSENLAERYTHINQDAVAYINGRMPEIYALNYNASGMDISAHVGGYSFNIISAGVIRNMADADASLLPHRDIDPAVDTPWNIRAINGEVSKGILLGESVPDIAKRLQNVTDMNKVSAVRNARTMVTAAENKGRMDEYRAAEEMGIILEREWLAADDYRTRNLHRELDGQTRAVGEPFVAQKYEIMYPGDPHAHPKMVYNCRCTLTAHVLGFEPIGR